jgi:hypothetical protein
MPELKLEVQRTALLVMDFQKPNAGAAPLAPWAKSARKAAKFTPWRPAPGK